jgi:hypothetical protein
MNVAALYNFSDAMTERKFSYQHMLHVSPLPFRGSLISLKVPFMLALVLLGWSNVNGNVNLEGWVSMPFS